MKRRLLSLILCLCMVLAVPAQTVFATDTTTTEEQSSDNSACTDWVTFHVKQGALQQPFNGEGWCTFSTGMMIVQNSGALSNKYSDQNLEGNYNGVDKEITTSNEMGTFKVWCETAPHAFHSSTGTGASGVLATLQECEDGWSGAGALEGGEGNAVVAFNGKSFDGMEREEELAALQAFWNNGYFCVLGISYGKDGATQNNNHVVVDGNTVWANHWVMCAGVDDTDIWISDPAHEAMYEKLNDTSKYWISYVVLYKHDTKSPLTLSGADRAGSEASAETLGIDSDTFFGFDEKGLASYCTLAEVNLTELFDEASIDNLNNQELTGLQNWKDNKEANEGGFISFGRKMVALFGILMILYAVLLYLGYWFDKINVYFNLDMVGILSFKKLKVSDNEEECTFSLTDQPKSEARTINHKYLVLICVMLIAFGVLLVSGMMYVVISGVVNWIRGLFG